MAARDKIHRAVKAALITDGWTVTADPYMLEYEGKPLLIDLAAERLLALQRGTEYIAVEIKTFGSPSPLSEFEKALGQFIIYSAALEEKDPDRKLYLAIPEDVYESVFTAGLIRAIVTRQQVSLVVIDIVSQEVVRWIT